MSARVERALPPAGGRAAADARICALLTGPKPGPIAERLAVLTFAGRRTGRRYTLPVGVHELDGSQVIATSGGWRHNFTGGGYADILWRSERRAAQLAAVTDPSRTARGYLDLYCRYQEAAGRRLGITVTGEPDVAAFRDAVDRCGLTLLEVRFCTSAPISPERTAL